MSATELFLQKRGCHTRKTVAATCPRYMFPVPIVCVPAGVLYLQHASNAVRTKELVPAPCPCNMSPSVCRLQRISRALCEVSVGLSYSPSFAIFCIRSLMDHGSTVAPPVVVLLLLHRTPGYNTLHPVRSGFCWFSRRHGKSVFAR